MRAAQRRLKKMRDAGLIRVVGQWMLREQGAQEYIYTLDKAGAEVVSVVFGLDPATIDWKPNSREQSYLFMNHLLAANDVGVAITLSCKKQGYSLLTWLHEIELRKQVMRDYVELAQAHAGEPAKRMAVVPDNFFRIKAHSIIGHFPAELDRDTESLKKVWGEKVLAYIQYHATGAYQKRYGARNFRLITVTTTQERLLNLKAATEAVAPGDDRFYFTTMDKVVTKQPARYTYTNPKTQKLKLYYKTVYNAELLTQPVWSRAGDTKLHSLLE